MGLFEKLLQRPARQDGGDGLMKFQGGAVEVADRRVRPGGAAEVSDDGSLAGFHNIEQGDLRRAFASLTPPFTPFWASRMSLLTR